MNIGLGGLLFVVFLVLKLTGYIHWSWWWVTSPLWIGFAISFFWFFLIALIGGGQRRTYSSSAARRRRRY